MVGPVGRAGRGPKALRPGRARRRIARRTETDPTFLSDATAGRRLSDDERRAAVAALERDRAEGRLTAEELSDRANQVLTAQVRGDLTRVFADLPTPRITPETRPPMWRPIGVMLIALSPFVAVVLFFLTGVAGGWPYSWLWFLLIPVTAIVVNGFRDWTRR
ncbi:MAG: DUF1707 SHOCT-like domain-containing protein [Amnibacterium sp.]